MNIETISKINCPVLPRKLINAIIIYNLYANGGTGSKEELFRTETILNAFNQFCRMLEEGQAGEYNLGEIANYKAMFLLYNIFDSLIDRNVFTKLSHFDATQRLGIDQRGFLNGYSYIKLLSKKRTEYPLTEEKIRKDQEKFISVKAKDLDRKYHLMKPKDSSEQEFIKLLFCILGVKVNNINVEVSQEDLLYASGVLLNDAELDSIFNIVYGEEGTENTKMAIRAEAKNFNGVLSKKTYDSNISIYFARDNIGAPDTNMLPIEVIGGINVPNSNRTTYNFRSGPA